MTASYYDPDGRLATLARRHAPDRLARLERYLLRRHHPDIPAARVFANPGVDLAIRLETRLPANRPRVRRALTRFRTDWFDSRLARSVERSRPGALLAFSDVASSRTFPACRRLGIPTILSMVHGDVREEVDVLDREAESSPEFLPIYLGNGRLDREELGWLHERRLQELDLAERVAVPSEHIARSIIRHGTPRERVRVIPYAADCRRFCPAPGKRHDSDCTFVFAGGISQRKGIKYLLEAWRLVRRPGWKLQLLGPMPREIGPIGPYMEMIETLGQVGHAEMPMRLARADVFVFPSLFEGSAVVTYEALASGLPCVVTPDAGSVVRDGIEGYVVGARDIDALAARMERLGRDPALREQMSAAARARALAYDWPRYHDSLLDLIEELTKPSSETSHETRRRQPTDRYELVP